MYLGDKALKFIDNAPIDQPFCLSISFSAPHAHDGAWEGIKKQYFWQEEVENYLHKKIEKGETVSPILPEGIKNYLIDIDGTICDDIPNEEPERMATAKLYPDALETINNWYEKGHIICFFTARIESHREVTEKWWDDNGFKYHSLLMGKPRGGNYHWIDNHLVKATRYNGKFTDLVEKKVTIEVFDDGKTK